jgi:2-oxoglutarate dehydrogenase complex dehydrogenase (E1) component-like enzyme
MVCYRRRGHNEGDDPSMTQPLMYRIIDAKPSSRALYSDALVGRGDISEDEAQEALAAYRSRLESAFKETREAEATDPGAWSNTVVPERGPGTSVDTAIPLETVKRIVDSQTALPDGFVPHPRVKTSVLERRATMIDADAFDWGMGETLAIGSLVLDGHPVRMAGQDTRRGTFVQRHAALIDNVTGEEFLPLQHLSPDQAPFRIYDSLLSEYAAMGFEYGYSVARPDAFVAWEAQFGDFADGGQMIIDEFLSSGEAKWGQRSGVALLLPHGYEGQGPDHSSARPERFLQLCAEDNMVVAMPSTPASYFHLLRGHTLGAAHKPMVVFTPKSLLRLKAAVSHTRDFTEGRFQPVLDDPHFTGGAADRDAVDRVILCAGRVYYDLAKKRDEQNLDSIALVRLERFYPHPLDEVTAVLEQYPAASDVLWVQEEPANMGAWPTLALVLPDALPEGRSLRRVSRRAAAAPAVGSAKAHEAEQNALVAAALAS